jgi:GT2 family glycosyltransferase
MTQIHRVSVIAAMSNEADNVETFVEDLAAQDFQGDTEFVVADGTSRDGSPALLRRAAESAGLDLRILENPGRCVSPGLNACIRAATGDLLVRMDCHSRYPPDYIRRCADAAEATGAWNVGGKVVPEGRTQIERAVACAMDSPFGGIGWTRLSRSDRPVEVDTVTFGAFRPEAFERAGLFDEALVRDQDDEFNLRLRRAGGRIVMDPRITVRYRPRGSLPALWTQYYEYGLWKTEVMRKHHRVASVRSLAPLSLVGSLGVLGVASSASATARALLGIELLAYAGGAVGFGIVGLRRRADPLSLLPVVIAAFPTIHLAYGMGMARGVLRRPAAPRPATAPS